MSNNECIIKVMSYVYTDAVIVLIPPRLWADTRIADGIKRCVEEIQTYSKQSPIRCVLEEKG